MQYLRAHPVLCLLLLTPGIPEYLSGSSPLSDLLLNPVWFALQLTANVGLYTTGVLLVREATVRWKKGWATVLLLGLAYGVLEEGVALSTMFDPTASVVGSLGFYGHWIGVNWVWAFALDLFHALFSVALPIFLLGLALPETRGRPLLTRRQVPLVFVLLGIDIVGLMALVLVAEHFWAGPALLIGAFLYIGGMIALAYRAPPAFLLPRHAEPSWRPWVLGLVGATFFPVLLLLEQIPQTWHWPAVIACLELPAVGAVYLYVVLDWMGRTRHQRQLVALAAGLVAPVACLGTITQLGTGVGLVPVLAAWGLLVLFFRHLWRRARVADAPRVEDSGPQRGAAGENYALTRSRETRAASSASASPSQS